VSLPLSGPNQSILSNSNNKYNNSHKNNSNKNKNNFLNNSYHYTNNLTVRSETPKPWQPQQRS